MNGGKTEFLALYNPVPGIPADVQAGMLAKFAPTESFLVGKDGTLDDFPKLVRPPRVVLVAYAGLLADQSRGSRDDRSDSMVAMKVAIHKKHSYVVEAGGRRSDKAWRAMKAAGDEMCRRLAQGAKSALNARRGAEPFEFADKHLSRFLLEMGRHDNDGQRLAAIKAYCKREKIQAPKRTWLKTKLLILARARGLTD